MAKSIPGRPVGQHTVSKFLLKRFADSRGAVAAYDVGSGRCSVVSVGTRRFEVTFDPHAPERSEALWGAVESRAAPAVARLRANREVDVADVPALKDLILVHWARSTGIMMKRSELTREVVAQSESSHWESSRPEVLAYFVKEHGRPPNGDEELRTFNQEIHRSIAESNQDQWHSERNPRNLEEARRVLWVCPEIG